MGLAAPISISMNWTTNGESPKFGPNTDITNSKIGENKRQISAHLSDCLAEEGLTIEAINMRI